MIRQIRDLLKFINQMSLELPGMRVGEIQQVCQLQDEGGVLSDIEGSTIDAGMILPRAYPEKRRKMS